MDLNQPYIIAEIGSNWRDPITAQKQIVAAKECGASAVKFQMFTHKELYGFEDGSPCFGLPRNLVPQLFDACNQIGIDFLCTAFSVDGYKFLDPYVRYHKLASCENDHPELLEWLSNCGKRYFRSHGAKSNYTIYPNEIPLECVASYPASTNEYSLQFFNHAIIKNWGISDHTTNNTLALVALGSGAMIFEKHFDGLFAGFDTPDTPVSCNPIQFKSYCDAIKVGYEILHQPKKINESEKQIITHYKRRHTKHGIYRTKPL